MKSRLSYLHVFGVLVLLTPSLFAQLHILGENSHFVFGDNSAKVNLRNSAQTACDDFFMVKKSDNAVAVNEYNYDGAGAVACELVLNNSNAIVSDHDLTVANSNWIVSNGAVTADVTELQGKMDFIDTWSVTIDHGPGNIDISLTSTNLIYDLWLSKHHKLNIDSSGGDVNFNGSTHFIHFAREAREPSGSDPMIIITGGNTFAFANVVLKDFSPQYLSLQGGSGVIFGNGTTIEITNNELVDSNYTISCSGQVLLNCFGNQFDLSNNNHAIDVLSSSTLVICNARITGLGAQNYNLKCLAPDSTLTLSNCELVLSSNYSFSEGSLNFYRDVTISGTNKFTYQSPRPATIQSYAQLKVDIGGTFSYDSGSIPANAGNNRLVMVDETSNLFFAGSTLHVTTTGLQLIKGTLVIDHVVEFEGETNDASGAITIGDGTASNNLNIEILPGGSIDVTSGYLSYKNN